LIAPSFGAINLEDISAPRAFEIEEKLQNIGIPVFHDDQHGTAIVVFAALMNASKVVGKSLEDLIVVINGAGAAGFAIMKFLSCMDAGESKCFSVKEIIMCDRKGIIHRERDGLNVIKRNIADNTNKENKKGLLKAALKGADVFIGVSAPHVLTGDMIKVMGKKPIIFAMANPVPEIDPREAKSAGAAIVATGRSDYPNQVNNILGFPGIFRGILDVRAQHITHKMKYAAGCALAFLVKNPSADHILPNPLDKNVVPAVAGAIRKAFNEDK